ncbi:agrin-like [Mercenaria mercenaria]|uniref:agrin-like n=1 Tax=Mercenaria mercenaria TaxID=6596 RepID=UPI00234F97AD|nr:agrin-like [Mercenaria mercenaria]
MLNVFLIALCIAAGSQAGGGISDSRREPCNQICEDDMYEVNICGTDGVLYGSMCEFDRAKCVATKNGTPLEVYSTGQCITLNTSCDVLKDPIVKCESKDVDLLCASNNITYDSVCEFMMVRCRHSPHKPLRLLHTGACVYDLSSAVQLNCSQYVVDTSELAVENATALHLNFKCHNHHSAESVCLMNGRTYYDACRYCELLYRQGTVTSTHLITYIQHTGSCHHSSVVG